MGFMLMRIKKKKEVPLNSRTLPGNTTNPMTKIISASSKTTRAVRTTIKSTFVTTPHGMDTKHFAYPKPIPTRCDSTPRIIAVRALVSDTVVLLKFNLNLKKKEMKPKRKEMKRKETSFT